MRVKKENVENSQIKILLENIWSNKKFVVFFNRAHPLGCHRVECNSFLPTASEGGSKVGWLRCKAGSPLSMDGACREPV